MKPKTPLLDADLATLDKLDVDAVVVCLPEDSRPLRGMAGFLDWRLCGRLSALIQEGSITGRRGERVLMPPHEGMQAKRLFFYGWGRSKDLTQGAPKAFAELASILEKAKVESCAVDLCWPGRALLPLVDEHLAKPLGKRLVGVFSPESQSANPQDKAA